MTARCRAAILFGMNTIAFVARKGGVSKTTLAAHVAVAAAASQPVTLLDVDPQGSLALWWNDRTAETPALMDVPVGRLATELAKAAGVDGLLVVDTPAFDSGVVAGVIQAADLVVIPVKPSPHDLRGVAVTVEAVKKAGKPFLFVITQAVAGAALTAQARGVLAASGPVAETVMHNRVAYAGSMTDGRTVIETEPSGRAAKEIAGVCGDVLAALAKAVKKTRGKNGR